MEAPQKPDAPGTPTNAPQPGQTQTDTQRQPAPVPAGQPVAPPAPTGPGTQRQ